MMGVDVKKEPGTNRRRWTLLAGGSAAGVAFLFALILFGTGRAGGRDAETWAMALSAAVASFIVGSLCWWLLVGRAGNPRLWRGLAAGGLTGLFAHPPTWYLVSLIYFLSGARSSLGEPTLNPLEALPGSLVLGAFSLVLVGWLTVPLGLLGGALLFTLYRRGNKDQGQAHDASPVTKEEPG